MDAVDDEAGGQAIFGELVPNIIGAFRAASRGAPLPRCVESVAPALHRVVESARPVAAVWPMLTTTPSRVSRSM